MEAEYVALAETLREAAWLRGLLTEIGLEQAKLKPLRIFEDNQSTIKLATNHANSNRTKHIDVRNYYCRQEQTWVTSRLNMCLLILKSSRGSLNLWVR